MLSKTIQYNGATVTLHRATVRDRIVTGMIINKLLPDLASDDDEVILMGMDETIAFLYARLLSQTSVEGDLGIPWPESSADGKTLQAALQAFLDADPELYDALRAAQADVDRKANGSVAAPQEGDSPKKD